MIWWEVGLFTLFALLLGAIAWWTWQQRQHAEKQRILSADLAKLGKEVHWIAHDVNNLLAAVPFDIAAARNALPEELPEFLDDVERAAVAASRLTGAMRGRPRTDPTGPASSEGPVRLSVAVLRSTEMPIVLEVTGDLPFEGSEADVLRIVQNLIANAVREASRVRGGRVRVVLGDGVLTVANPVADGARLDDRIYEEGVSGSASTGLGLRIAREACGRLGWGLRHEVENGAVRFIVEPRPVATSDEAT